MDHTEINPLVSKDNQRNLVLPLKEARRTIGKGRLHGLLPAPLELQYVSHETGCHAWIRLKAEGRETLEVWHGSIWYAREYEFNDRNKVLGINPDYLFAQDALVRFFETVEKLRAETITDGMTDVAKAVEKREGDVDYYRKQLGR